MTIQRQETGFVDEIKKGDCIFFENRWMTVSKEDLPFFRRQALEMPFYHKIEFALFPKWFRGRITGWYRQF